MGQSVLEQIRIDAENDVGEHLDEAAVGVPCESWIAGLLGEAQDGSVVQSQVQDGVHHAGHRERRAGTNRDQKRIGIVTEALTHAPLEVGGRRIDLIESAIGPHVTGRRVLHAGLARDGVAGRDR